MARSGLLKDFRIGNQRYFQANPEFIFFAEIRSICVKSFGFADVIRDALKQFKHDIEFAFVFGSLAKGTDRQGSDIDLLIVGDVDLFAVSVALEPAEQQLSRVIHHNVHNMSEWEHGIQAELHGIHSCWGENLDSRRYPKCLTTSGTY